MEFKFKYYLGIIVFAFIIGCKTQRINNEPYSKAEYIFAYKKAVLYGCINAKTNKGLEKMLSTHNDMGLSKEVAILFHAETIKANLLGKKYSAKIPSRSCILTR